MDMHDDLLTRAQSYAEQRKITLTTASKHLFGDATTLQRMLAGGSLTLRKYESAVAALDAAEAAEPDQ